MKAKREKRDSDKFPKKTVDRDTYRTMWRWHLYAGILFAPLLVLLAVTGSVYLFKTEIESVIYQEYYQVDPQKEKVAVSEQLEEVKRLYPEAIVTKYQPGE